ncbi:MAG: 16S rRNA (cytosine967-C5)-methyltransferase [Paracoccaceae bacterium]|jgi:16S rRNA (cytosine967-C5)-methyltransferase
MNKPDDLAARRGALKLIDFCLNDGGMLVEEMLPNDLAGPDRARALTLARAVLRWIGPADMIIDQFTQHRPKGRTLMILRLGVTEMLALDEAAYGVVDACVRIAKADRTTRTASGLINAVLRKASTEGPAIWGAANLARLSCPGWFWRVLSHDWGKATAQAIAAAHLVTPSTDLTLKTDTAEMAKKSAIELDGIVTPSGSIRLSKPGRLSGLHGYDDDESGGAWWAQDAAAAIPARLAGAGKGRRALDLCAAPGGKTMQLAAAGWQVTALDIAANRLGRVTENLKRTRLNAELVEADAMNWVPDQLFDMVLLDAPCSATGTVRRHPELPHLRDTKGLGQPTGLQRRLLKQAWTYVAPGGTLIYCTCAMTKSEGEDQIKRFLHMTPNVTRVPVTAEETGDAQMINADGDLRTRPDMWPEIGGMDGFFASRLVKTA